MTKFLFFIVALAKLCVSAQAQEVPSYTPYVSDHRLEIFGFHGTDGAKEFLTSLVEKSEATMQFGPMTVMRIKWQDINWRVVARVMDDTLVAFIPPPDAFSNKQECVSFTDKWSSLLGMGTAYERPAKVGFSGSFSVMKWLYFPPKEGDLNAQTLWVDHAGWICLEVEKEVLAALWVKTIPLGTTNYLLFLENLEKTYLDKGVEQKILAAEFSQLQGMYHLNRQIDELLLSMEQAPK